MWSWVRGVLRVKEYIRMSPAPPVFSVWDIRLSGVLPLA